MKHFNTTWLKTALLLPIACFLGFATAAAGESDTHLVVGENNTIDVHGTTPVTVPISLVNDVPVQSLQFNIVVEGFEVTEVAFDTDRLSSDYFMTSYTESNGLVMVLPMPTSDMQPIAAGDGPIAYVTLQREETPSSVSMKLQKIIFAYSGDSDAKQADLNVTVNVYSSIIVTSPETETGISIKPEGEATVTLGVENSEVLEGIQFNIYLPEGFEYVDKSFAMTEERKVAGSAASIKYSTNEKCYTVIISNLMYNKVVTGNSGDFASFKIKAGAEIAENAQVEIKNFMVSILGGRTNPAENSLALNITNLKISFDEIVEQINDLQTALEAVLAEIETTCPDVAAEFTGEAIEQAIAQALIDAQAVYDSNSTDYSAVSEEIAQIQKDIEALKADAEAAQAAKEDNDRQAANQAAYEVDLAAINALQEQLDAALAEINENYAGYADEEANAAVQAQIDALTAAAKAALEAVATEGEYESVITEENVAAIEDAINALVPAAQAAKEEGERQAANQTAYNADMSAINALQDKLDAAIDEINSKYAKYADEQANAAVQAKIDALKAAAKAAFEAVAEEGEYESVVDSAEVAEIEAEIEALVTAAQEAAELEAERQASNQNDYEADLALINELQRHYNNVVAQIQDNYPDFYSAVACNEVQDMILDAKDAVEEEYASVQESGYYDSPLDYDAILAAIDQLLTDAENSAAGIDGIYMDGSDKVEIYSIEGRKLNEPEKGKVNIFIINGKTQKMIVK